MELEYQSGGAASKYGSRATHGPTAHVGACAARTPAALQHLPALPQYITRPNYFRT